MCRLRKGYAAFCQAQPSRLLFSCWGCGGVGERGAEGQIAQIAFLLLEGALLSFFSNAALLIATVMGISTRLAECEQEAGKMV